MLGAPGAGAQGTGCQQAVANMQCSELGSIAMDAQDTIGGAPVDVTTRITITHNYQERNAQVPVRRAQRGHGTPGIATPEATRLTTASGDLRVADRRRPSATEVNTRVDVPDVPVGQEIQLTTRAGATDKDAYRLEVLVQPFDKDHHAIEDGSGSGNDASLFSSTLLIVNEATGAVSGGTRPFGGEVGNALRVPGADATAAPVAGSLLARRARSPGG